MRFASLGSGSGGNALVVEAGATRVLIDCGLGPREAERRLTRLGLAPGDLVAILVTHEHSDHLDGVFPFARRHGLRVHLTHGTLAAAGDAAYGEGAPGYGLSIIDSHSTFAVGDLEVHPFPVPHDAREPVQYVLCDGVRRLGVLTDTGAPTRHVEAMLGGCDALVLECNHDPAMLAASPYPGWLKTRIGGGYGHLPNAAAAAILAAIDHSRLRHVVAAHLSAQNNTPALAQAALAAVMGCAPEWIGVAAQDGGFDWRSLA
jgi:phosphoribosyl 1,2-cyclic phosphodiesterase